MPNRNFAMGLRTGKRKITDDEKDFILKEIDRICANPNIFLIDETGKETTHYVDIDDLVIVGSNVFPDLEHPANITDKLTVACVLAHEYYGHRAMRNDYLNEKVDSIGSYKDEFNASYLAFQNTPNLAYEEKSMLLYHAYEIAREGYLKEECEKCEKLICDFCFSNDKTKKILIRKCQRIMIIRIRKMLCLLANLEAYISFQLLAVSF